MKIKLLDPKCMPYKKYTDDAGIDLKSRIDSVLWPGITKMLPAGICIAVPQGYVGDISPRSSISIKGLVIQGKVDCGYSGEVGIIATNTTNEFIHIEKGARIAQLVLMQISTEEIEIVDELPESDRGTGGFGSTGV